MYRLVCIAFMVLVAMPIICLASSYDIIVNEAGEALILIALEGKGTFQIPLPEDVNEVKVKGALYLIENHTLEVSIGSTNEAAILFKTNTLTRKQQYEWAFSLNVMQDTKKVTLSLPKEATISETQPKVLVEDLDYKKIVWDNPQEKVFVSYSFLKTNALPNIEDFRNERSLLYPAMVSLGILMLAGSIVYLSNNKKKKAQEKKKKDDALDTENESVREQSGSKGNNETQNEKRSTENPEAKRNIIKTLSPNEALIVTTIMESENAIKRNELERRTKLAKSSLASSLHNLEQKNIVMIDKAQTVHFVQLTEWFKQL